MTCATAHSIVRATCIHGHSHHTQTHTNTLTIEYTHLWTLAISAALAAPSSAFMLSNLARRACTRRVGYKVGYKVASWPIVVSRDACRSGSKRSQVIDFIMHAIHLFDSVWMMEREGGDEILWLWLPSSFLPSCDESWRQRGLSRQGACRPTSIARTCGTTCLVKRRAQVKSRQIA